jgi:hypothetical protein
MRSGEYPAPWGGEVYLEILNEGTAFYGKSPESLGDPARVSLFSRMRRLSLSYLPDIECLCADLGELMHHNGQAVSLAG